MHAISVMATIPICVCSKKIMVSNVEFASDHSLSSNGKAIRVYTNVLVYVAHVAKIKISVKCALLI